MISSYPLTIGGLRQAALRHRDAEIWQHLDAEFKRQDYRPNSVRTYRTGFRLVMDYSRSEPRDGDFDFRAFRVWLQQQGYRPTTVDVRLAQARVLLRALLRRLPEPIALPRPSGRELTSLPYTDAEVEKLLTCAHIEERVLVLLVLEAALTVKDIVALKRSDIEFEPRPVLTLWPKGRSKEGHESSMWVPVRLSPLLDAELQRWFARTPKMEAVIPNPSQDTINAKMRNLCRRAGVPCRGLRGLRVTAGVRAYRETGSLQVVMARLRLRTVQQAQAYARAAATLHCETGE